jgi:hypothetical protein
MPMQTFDVEFTKSGEAFQAAQVDAMLHGLAPVTDLLVVSHGWNNDIADARALYDELLGNVDKLLALRDQSPGAVPAPLRDFVERLRNRTFAAVCIFWPSKKFTDGDLIPGGGAASVQAEAENLQLVSRLLEQLKEDPERLGSHERPSNRETAMERAKALVPHLATVDAQREYVALLRVILDSSVAERDDASEGFFSAAPETLFANASMPVAAPNGSAGGGGVGVGDGGAAGLGDLLSGVQAAARRIANFATYYQMKSRAGTVGVNGVGPLLRRIRATKAIVRLHLVGHSFGGRVVTAAAHGLPTNTPAATMSLLQAAFSHNGLSDGFGDDKQRGFFRALVDERRISGPIIITHTKNDNAVGIAYPLASRLAGQNASALGDQNDPYGGMGRNGAQHTREAVSGDILGLPGTKYRFEPGKIHNVLSDVIKDHGDVRRIEVAYAVLSAAGTI